MKKFLSILLILISITGVLVSCKSKNKIDGSEGLEYTLSLDGDSYYVSGIGACTDVNIKIPSSYEGFDVIGIANGAFEDCDLIESIVISKNVKSIGDYAFKGCFSLESVDIPYSVTSVGEYAFADCSALESITIPYTVTSFGAWAFDGCDALTKVHYTGDIDNWIEIKFYPYNSNPMKYAKDLYFDGELVSSVEIPDYISAIGSFAFEGVSSLVSVDIPNSVTSIGEMAFLGCYSLRSITIPSSVTNIGQLAFSQCTSLATINFEGTKAEWINIEKGTYWDDKIPATEVICTDGTVSIK